jgi:glycolate oxidase
VVKLCAQHNLPIIPRGAGTSLSGTVLAVTGGVMIALTRMNRILDIDYRNRRALVESGVVNAWVTNAVKARGLLYAPDPSSQPACTIGGNVGTNSGGPHTLKYGVTTNHVLGFELVLPDGEVAWLGTTPDGGEDVPGYDLRGAAIGSEGMFGVVTRVLVRLVRAPQAYKTMLGVFETVDDASATVSEIIGAGIVPGALEMMDQLITQAVEAAYHFGFPLDAGAVLIVELDGLAAGLEEQAAQVMSICRRNRAREVRLARDDQERADLWKSRKRAFGAIGRLSPNFLTQDGVVPRSKLPEMMRFVQACSEKYGLRIPNVFHAGDGNLHPLILYDEREPDQIGALWRPVTRSLPNASRWVVASRASTELALRKWTSWPNNSAPTIWRPCASCGGPSIRKGRCNPHKMFPGSKRCADFAPRKQVSA